MCGQLPELTIDGFLYLEGTIKNTPQGIETKIKNFAENYEQIAIWNEIGLMAGILDQKGNRQGTNEELLGAYNQLIRYWNEYVESCCPKNREGLTKFMRKKFNC